MHNEQITLQIESSNLCCEKLENLVPALLVNAEGRMGVSHFCDKCKHLFIRQAQFMEFGEVGDVLNDNGMVNVFTDLPKIQNIVARIQAKIKYVCYLDGVSDPGLTATLGMEEVKLAV